VAPLLRRLAILVGVFVLLGALLLGLPGVPYNLTELVPEGKRLFGLLGLAITILLASVPAILVARRTGREGGPIALLPAALLLSGGAAYALLRAAVPVESLHDVVGSPVLSWPWECETLGRFLALFALPQLLCFLANLPFEAKKRALPGMALALGLLLLARAVVLPWAATDNLTELVGREILLWPMLLLGVLHAAALARCRGRPLLLLALFLLLPLAAVASDLLAREAFAPRVEKYGAVFSARQFLLSPGRDRYLDAAEIALLWRLLHAAAVLALAAVHRAALAPPRPRALPDAAGDPPPNRRTWRALLAGWGAFALYGSLVPLSFRPVGLAEALERFRSLPWLRLGIGSRADWVANVLLFLPLGFAAAGAFRERGPRRIAPIVAGALLLSLLLEFAQIHFPPRTVSANDVAAETLGALCGALLWTFLGTRIEGWLRSFLSDREPARTAVRLLVGYALLFAVAQMLPLDLAPSPYDLAEKWKEGRIRLRPFSHVHESSGMAAWDFFADALLYAPIGALCLLGWNRPGRRRSLPKALLLGFGAVAAIELCQTFVWSRFTDTTDLLSGGLGVAAGALFAAWRSGRPAEAAAPGGEPALRAWPLLAALLWALLLVGVYTYPFDFVVEGERARRGLRTLLSVPFAGYYYRSEYFAITLLLRKLLFAAPFGALARLGFAPRSRAAAWLVVALAGGLFFAIEALQLFLPGRVGDATDVAIGVLGALLGLFLAGRLRAAPAASPAGRA